MVGKLSRSQGHNTLLDATPLPQKLSAQRLNGLLKRNPQFQIILRSSWQTLSSSWLAWLGIHIIFTSYQNDIQTTSHLTLRIDPRPAQLSRWDIFIHLKLRVLLNSSGFKCSGVDYPVAMSSPRARHSSMLVNKGMC
ncbi:hypothetical protein BJY01DRAFT_220386 [Aspergillus pseudoustus]|uniref:Uncharacterized protein n=1 Tax=Aspergillus pseudoustus TaxID=1810923 RepID=A0ABR4JD42_9EURO